MTPTTYIATPTTYIASLVALFIAVELIAVYFSRKWSRLWHMDGASDAHARNATATDGDTEVMQ